MRLVLGSNYSGNEQIHRTRRYSLKLRCSPGPKTACLFFAQKCLQHEQIFRFSRTGIFNCLKIAQTKQGVSRNGDPDLVQFASGCTQPVETVSFEPEVFRFLKNSGILVPHNSRNSHLAGRTFFVTKKIVSGVCLDVNSRPRRVNRFCLPSIQRRAFGIARQYHAIYRTQVAGQRAADPQVL